MPTAGSRLLEFAQESGQYRFTEDSIAQAVKPAKMSAPRPEYEGSAVEHARRIIDVVVADNPVDRKAA